MQIKPSALQLAVLWVVIALLTTACGGTSTNCDDPRTPAVEACGTSHSTATYYRSGGSSYIRGSVKGSGVSRTGLGIGKTSGRSGFGSSGGGRSGFG